MSRSALDRLAAAAGIAVRWRDAFGTAQRVAPPTLRAVLAAVGRPAGTQAEVADSLDALRRPPSLPRLVTAETGRSVPLPLAPGRFRLQLESGGVQDGMLVAGPDGRTLAPAVAEAGYHRLETAAGETVLAVAPPRCFDLAQLAEGPAANPRLWGLSVPLYGLRRPGDGGVGDYPALARFVAAAGAAGAAAVAISPVHAQFSADPTQVQPLCAVQPGAAERRPCRSGQSGGRVATGAAAAGAGRRTGAA